jgi:hypothetical protein
VLPIRKFEFFRTDGLIPGDLAIPTETLTVFTHLACL